MCFPHFHRPQHKKRTVFDILAPTGLGHSFFCLLYLWLARLCPVMLYNLSKISSISLQHLVRSRQYIPQKHKKLNHHTFQKPWRRLSHSTLSAVTTYCTACSAYPLSLSIYIYICVYILEYLSSRKQQVHSGMLLIRRLALILLFSMCLW
jgi:hypothetical protein